MLRMLTGAQKTDIKTYHNTIMKTKYDTTHYTAPTVMRMDISAEHGFAMSITDPDTGWGPDIDEFE